MFNNKLLKKEEEDDTVLTCMPRTNKALCGSPIEKIVAPVFLGEPLDSNTVPEIYMGSMRRIVAAPFLPSTNVSRPLISLKSPRHSKTFCLRMLPSLSMMS